jgi:hypothetical protein
MTFYNYELCYVLGRGIPKKILYAYKVLENKGGDDFILNPQALFNSKASDLHKSQYLGLAALRNYDDFAETQKTTLSRSLVPSWISLEGLEDNPLLTINETEIIFNKE